MIKDFKVNEIISLPLVVTSAVARETKAKKPYLQLELYDGTDTIQGNYWDWTSGKIPEKNTILDVSGQVTEYAGNKQINIKSLSTNTTKHLSEFTPKSTVDLGSIYMQAIQLASSVHDEFLMNLTLSILEDLRYKWLEVPGARGVHHAFVGGTLVHSVAVAKVAKAISQQYPEANEDLCVVGGLLHDLGKLFTYTLNGITIDMTSEGMLYDHTFMGAEFVGNYVENLTLHAEDPCVAEKLEILRHIILSHHGVLEFGAAVPPMCIEAHIVSKADGVDAAIQQVIEASRKVGDVKFTDRIYPLGNRPQITPQYVKEVMAAQFETPLEGLHSLG